MKVYRPAFDVKLPPPTRSNLSQTCKHWINQTVWIIQRPTLVKQQRLKPTTNFKPLDSLCTLCNAESFAESLCISKDKSTNISWPDSSLQNLNFNLTFKIHKKWFKGFSFLKIWRVIIGISCFSWKEECLWQVKLRALITGSVLPPHKTEE